MAPPVQPGEVIHGPLIIIRDGAAKQAECCNHVVRQRCTLVVRQWCTITEVGLIVG